MGEGNAHRAPYHLFRLRVEFEAQARARSLGLGDSFDVSPTMVEEVEAVLGQEFPLSLAVHIIDGDHYVLRPESGCATTIRRLLGL